MDLDLSYPTLADIKRKTKKRVPHFVWEYLDSATGDEKGKQVNRDALDAVRFTPAILKGPMTPNLATSFLGQTYDLPFGVAPVGMSGLIWPEAEFTLAQKAVEHNIPYSLSTVATQLPEDVGPHAGQNGWMQLYPPKDPEMRRDMIRRGKEAGFHTLVLTVDVPVPSRRERQRRAQLSIPPKTTPSMLMQVAMRPEWALRTLITGTPRLKFPESYVKAEKGANSTAHAGYLIRGTPDLNYLKELRDEWDGPLILKGVQDASDVPDIIAIGIDAIWVSNHSARQFAGGPAAIEVLPDIRKAAGPNFPIIFDSGIEGGLDILRGLAKGANFVMLGRAFHYALAAFGPKGIDHLIHILKDDMLSNLGQIGITDLKKLHTRLR